MCIKNFPPNFFYNSSTMVYFFYNEIAHSGARSSPFQATILLKYKFVHPLYFLDIEGDTGGKDAARNT